MLSSKNDNAFRIILPTKITRVFGTKEVKKQLFFDSQLAKCQTFLDQPAQIFTLEKVVSISSFQF